MKANGRELDVRKESILVEQDRTSSPVCHVEAIRQKLVLKVFNCFLQGDDVPLPRNMFSIAPSFPRRVLGFQFLTLSLACSVNRLGTSLLK